MEIALFIILVIVIATGWSHYESKINDLEARIEELEAERNPDEEDWGEDWIPMP